MSNVVESSLYAEGTREQVNDFVTEGLPALLAEPEELKTQHAEMREWRKKHLGAAWLAHSKAETIRDANGIKIVRIDFESAWNPPYHLFTRMIRAYHCGKPTGASNLRFHLFWTDQDGGMGPDDLFGGDCTIGSMSFGELYTEPPRPDECHESELSDDQRVDYKSWFNEDQGEVSFIAVTTGSDVLEITKAWFEERGLKVLSERDGIELVREAYPDHAVYIAKWPTKDEVLHESVVNCVQKLNELILQTWGVQWFEENNKKVGEITAQELGGVYEMLLDEAYGDYDVDHVKAIPEQVTAEGE